MKPEELAYLAESETCPCGHSMAFHETYDCEFCRIEGCPCEWGSPTGPEPRPVLLPADRIVNAVAMAGGLTLGAVAVTYAGPVDPSQFVNYVPASA